MSKKNYSKMSTTPAEEIIETVTDVEEVVEVEADVEATLETEPPMLEKLKGVVTGCTKLNLRKKPFAGAEILDTLEAGETVVITELETFSEKFYGVDANGLKGYCMKQYISIQE